MENNAEDIDKKLKAIEAQMNAPDFWSDKNRAKEVVAEYEALKLSKSGLGKYDKGSAIMTIFGGAGGADAEDFAQMLVSMYWKFIENRGWKSTVIHKNENDHGGYRNITFEVQGKGVYGTLKNESGVHRLVRISPFNAQKKRHTSFAMVEVIPMLKKSDKDIEVSDSDLDIQFTKSGGPGGQNVNKRETAVRIVHIPTGIQVHVSSERNQAQNKELAMEILLGKLYNKLQLEEKLKEKGLKISATTDIEWGNQIRSYVLHPYKMVKDHRTDVEVHDVEKVLEDGDLEIFIEAEKDL
jgi:peptide chain release factor 2